MNWDWVTWNFGVSAAWHFTLLVGVVVVLMRGRDRRVTAVAVSALTAMLLTSIARHGLVNTLSQTGVLIKMRQLVALSEALSVIDFFTRAVGIGLLTYAAFLRRAVTAPRAP